MESIDISTNEAAKLYTFMSQPTISDFFLFVTRFYVPVNNISVMSEWSHRFLGITSTFAELSVLLKDTTWA